MRRTTTPATHHLPTSLHHDQKFRALAPEARYLWLSLLTHPALSPIGAIATNLRGLQEDLKLAPDTFLTHLETLQNQGMLTYSQPDGLILITNHLRHNPPRSAAAAARLARAFDQLPESDLRDAYLLHLLPLLRVHDEHADNDYKTTRAFLGALPPQTHRPDLPAELLPPPKAQATQQAEAETQADAPAPTAAQNIAPALTPPTETYSDILPPPPPMRPPDPSSRPFDDILPPPPPMRPPDPPTEEDLRLLGIGRRNKPYTRPRPASLTQHGEKYIAIDLPPNPPNNPPQIEINLPER